MKSLTIRELVQQDADGEPYWIIEIGHHRYLKFIEGETKQVVTVDRPQYALRIGRLHDAREVAAYLEEIRSSMK